MSRAKLATAIVLLMSVVSPLVIANPSLASSVPGFEACSPGPSCDIEAVNFRFANYSSVCSLQDCNFVSAANWEELVLALSPSVATIKSEYAAAGQTFGGGLSMPQLWSYWQSYGIDGVRLASEQSYVTDRTDVENAVLDFGALLVRDVSQKNEHLGTEILGSGTALMVVDGFTPKGPLIVYQAREIQMTWMQWNQQVKDMWGVVASVTTGATSTTTTTLPVNSTTTTTAPSTSNYGPKGEKYLTYGNVYPADLGDCTFAAAANWEQLVLGSQPDPSVIGYEFAQAGGSATEGLTIDQLFAYWESSGIAGVTIGGVQSYFTTPQDVESAVDDYKALIVSLDFVDGDYFGNQPVSAGGHAVVLDGYTPIGPLVVSWGQTIQMSWDQWNAEVVGMWGIESPQGAVQT